MKKKKVFIYIHQGILKGGVEKVFHTLLNNMPMEMYDITVLSVMGYLSSDFDCELYPKSVRRHCLMWDEFSKNFYKRVCQKIHNRFFPWLYKQYLKYKHYDIAIAAQEGNYARFIFTKVKAKRKVLWIHNDLRVCHWTGYQFNNYHEEASLYRKFDKVICVSSQVAQGMNEVFGKMDNICVCYNPINITEIEHKIKVSLPKHPDVIWFVCVGRLAYQKGYDRLLEVCRRLNEEGYKFHISILGEGEDRHKIEDLIREYHIHNVELCGNQTNPFKYIKAADWFLQTSRHEGFGLALYESAYCGTPVITTDVAGAKELLGDSEYGIVTANSTDGIYLAMKRVLDNTMEQEIFRTKIRKIAKTISMQSRIDEIMHILNG